MDNLLEVKDLKKYFKTRRGMLHAVDGVNLQIEKGKTLGVVGESGCGKSTLGRVLVKLLPATSGEVIFEGKSILGKVKKENDPGTRMQMIFQDPYSSLNPRMTVSELIAEPLKVDGKIKNRKELDERVFEMMYTVGLAPNLINSYPHELDGGRRQRVGIARSLVLDPSFIVCDEPVSALDVSIQAQILNLLMDIQEERNVTYMFITHNLAVVKHISNEIAVMYLGQCVERASSNELFKNPLHPYTRALLNAVPIASTKIRRNVEDVIRGEITSPIDPAPGCRFAPRCPFAKMDCTKHDLAFQEVSEGHFVSCINYEGKELHI